MNGSTDKKEYIVRLMLSYNEEVVEQFDSKEEAYSFIWQLYEKPIYLGIDVFYATLTEIEEGRKWVMSNKEDKELLKEEYRKLASPDEYVDTIVKMNTATPASKRIITTVEKSIK